MANIKKIDSSNSMSRKILTQLRRGLAGILISGMKQVYIVPAFMLMTQHCGGHPRWAGHGGEV